MEDIGPNEVALAWVASRHQDRHRAQDRCLISLVDQGLSLPEPDPVEDSRSGEVDAEARTGGLPPRRRFR
ncbi:hypothetical protein ACN6LA_000003 [Streptomyces sp. SAS_269]